MNHSFDRDLAATYGLHEAILIQHFQFWIDRNRANGKHCYDGRTWSYNSVAAYARLFPYLTPHQIRRTLESLIEQGVLMSGRYGEQEGWRPFDRRLWYAFVDEERFVPESAAAPRSDMEPDEECVPVAPFGSGAKCMTEEGANAFGTTAKSAFGKTDTMHLALVPNESKEALKTGIESTHGESNQSKANGCLLAEGYNDSDSDEVVRTPHARAREEPDPPLSEGAALLMLPVGEGGAGILRRDVAEEIGGARPLEELKARLEYARKRDDIDNIAGFLIATIRKNAPPPESYVRRLKPASRPNAACYQLWQGWD